MNSARSLPTPGPATVRLALIRTGIEVFGLEYMRDELFAHIRAMRIRIRPPERVALTQQVLHVYKVDEKARETQVSTAPIAREFAHAAGPLTVYVEVPSQDRGRWEGLLKAIGYWGQASSLVYCTRTYQSEPNPKECVMLLQDWKSSDPMSGFFASIL